jgi:hypothetical protein
MLRVVSYALYINASEGVLGFEVLSVPFGQRGFTVFLFGSSQYFALLGFLYLLLFSLVATRHFLISSPTSDPTSCLCCFASTYKSADQIVTPPQD